MKKMNKFSQMLTKNKVIQHDEKMLFKKSLIHTKQNIKLVAYYPKN